MNICLHMYACMYGWMDGCLQVCMYVYRYVRMYVCMYVRMYVCMYVCLYVCMYVCLYVCMHACMYVCMYVCIHICMHICMYIYIYMHICIYRYRYMCVYCNHEVPRWRTVFFLKQWRLRRPHSSCGGRDIACCHIGELRELGHLGEATLCDFLLWIWTSNWGRCCRFWRFVHSKGWQCYSYASGRFLSWCNWCEKD